MGGEGKPRQYADVELIGGSVDVTDGILLVGEATVERKKKRVAEMEPGNQGVCPPLNHLDRNIGGPEKINHRNTTAVLIVDIDWRSTNHAGVASATGETWAT